MTIEKDICYRARRGNGSLLCSLTIRADSGVSIVVLDATLNDLGDVLDLIEYVLSIHKTEPTPEVPQAG